MPKIKMLDCGSYSQEELTQLEIVAANPKIKISRAALTYGRKFNRSSQGVYAKLRKLRRDLNNPVVQQEEAVISVEEQAPAIVEQATPVFSFNIMSIDVYEDHIKLYYSK